MKEVITIQKSNVNLAEKIEKSQGGCSDCKSKV